jgi:hypothetical protein
MNISKEEFLNGIRKHRDVLMVLESAKNELSYIYTNLLLKLPNYEACNFGTMDSFYEVDRRLDARIKSNKSDFYNESGKFIEAFPDDIKELIEITTQKQMDIR